MPSEMALDVRGMDRPRARLGMLQVEIHLALSKPLLQLYTSTSPMFGVGHRPRTSTSSDTPQTSEDVIDVNKIKWNIVRIKAVLTTPPALFKLVDYLRF